MVECQLPKLKVASSSLVTCSSFPQKICKSAVDPRTQTSLREVHMKSAIILFGCLAFLFLSSSAGSAPARQQNQREEFVATGNMPSVGGGEMIGPGSTVNVNIVLDSYSTDQEARVMVSQFASGGYKALRKSLGKATVKGRITLGRDGSFELKLVRSKTTAGIRRIFAVGERPIRFFDAYYSGRTHDYQFGVLQLELKADGGAEDGSGVLIHGGRVKVLEADAITLEESAVQPVRLAGVRKP